MECDACNWWLDGRRRELAVLGDRGHNVSRSPPVFRNYSDCTETTRLVFRRTRARGKQSGIPLYFHIQNIDIYNERQSIFVVFNNFFELFGSDKNILYRSTFVPVSTSTRVYHYKILLVLRPNDSPRGIDYALKL